MISGRTRQPIWTVWQKRGAIEVLTVNGEAKGVIMAPRVFDEMAERIEVLEVTASVKRGLADAAAGRTRPASAAIEKLANELGLDLGSDPA